MYSYSITMYPDLMNMTKRKPTMVPEPRLEKKSGRGKKGKETDRSDADREKENRKKNSYLTSNRVKERNQIEPISDRKEYERTLTLTLVSHSDEPEKNNSNQKGESGGRIYLAVRRMNLRRRGRRSRTGGAGSPGSTKEAPRPGCSTVACSPVGEHARRRGGR